MKTEELEAIEVLVNAFRERLISYAESTAKMIMNVPDSEVLFNKYAQNVADYYNIDKENMMKNGNRVDEVKTARQIVWYFARTGETRLPLSLQNLGLMMDRANKFDHATVKHATTRIGQIIEVDNEFRHDVSTIANHLGFELVKGEKGYTIKRIELMESNDVTKCGFCVKPKNADLENWKETKKNER